VETYVSYDVATIHEKERNRRLKSVRETIEHNYALTKNLFKYLSRVEKLKILKGKTVLKIYTVCTFLRNCHVMMYGCETSNYFNILLDTRSLLEEYTRYQSTLLNEEEVEPEQETQSETIIENVPLQRSHLNRTCRVTNLNNNPTREYIPTNKVSLPGIHLGLAQSDIPGAGLGVFLLQNYDKGTNLTIYAGKLLTEDELEQPGYDTTYVWSDRNNIEDLARRNLSPLIIDANPLFSPLDWGGMINDGLTRENNVTLVRFRNLVYVKLLKDGVAGMELYLEYGIEYWQEKYYSVNQAIQEELVAYYGDNVVPYSIY